MNVYVSFFLKSSPKGRSHSLMMPNVFFRQEKQVRDRMALLGLGKCIFFTSPNWLGDMMFNRNLRK